MTELNLDLLKKVLDKIVSDPDEHNPMHWMVKTGSTSPVREVTGGVALSCPTTACVAGWACALAGDDPFIGDGSMHYYRDRSDGFIYVEEVVTPDRESNQVSIAPVLLIFVLFFVAYVLKSYATSMVAFSYALLVVFRLVFYRYIFMPAATNKRKA